MFTSGADFAVVSEYRFPDLDEAAGFLAYEIRGLKGLGSVGVFGTQSLSGGTTYVLHGQTRSRGRDVFCDGVLFNLKRSTYLVSTCSPHPNSADLAEALAVRVRGLAE